MKRFALPLSLLVVLVFAQACTDATSPNPNALLAVTNPTLDGNVPPPPTKTAITITVNSPSFIGRFTGVYFANGGNAVSVAAASELGDAALAFNGTAWLRLDNVQTSGSTASANARFQVTNQRFSGHGTLVMNDEFGIPHTITIGEVHPFVPNPDCNFPGAPCVVITFDATVDDDTETIHDGTAAARACVLVTVEGESYYDCGS